MACIFPMSDLKLYLTDMDSRTITIDDLWGILKECMSMGYVNEYAVHRIVELAEDKALSAKTATNTNE